MFYVNTSRIRTGDPLSPWPASPSGPRLDPWCTFDHIGTGMFSWGGGEAKGGTGTGIPYTGTVPVLSVFISGSGSATLRKTECAPKEYKIFYLHHPQHQSDVEPGALSRGHHYRVGHPDLQHQHGVCPFACDQYQLPGGQG